jgi:integrase
LSGIIVNGNSTLKESLNDLPFTVSEDIGSHEVTVIGKQLNSFPSYNSKHQVCASEGEAKNLATVESRQKWAAGATADVNGYLINCEAKMILKGLKPETILGRLRALRLLMKRGANLLDPYSVFKAIDHAKRYDPVAKTLLDKEWSDGAKALAAQAYKIFCITAGIQIPEEVNFGKWSKFTQKIPWLPLEEEINALIVGSSKKVAAFLQLLKEVWCRAGEGWQLKWADVDQAHNLITINSPEKNGLPRQFKVSDRLIAMLNRLPKKNERVFGDATLQGFRRNFMQQRKRIAYKLQNPRILKITFHTLRHWGASMEYHRTKVLMHVKERLGHRSILSTEIYTHLLNFESDEYHVKRASTREEENSLIEAGFEFIRYDTTHNEAIYRKRK